MADVQTTREQTLARYQKDLQDGRIKESEYNRLVAELSQTVEKPDLRTFDDGHGDDVITVDEVGRVTGDHAGVLKKRQAGISASPRPGPDDFMPVSSPATTMAAIRVARRWNNVPDSMPNSQAISSGFIPPELLELLMGIFMDMFINCLANQPSHAWKRVQTFVAETNKMNRIGDNVRLMMLADKWFDRLGYPRDRGDVKLLVKAIATEASGLKEEEFNKLQMEAMFLSV